LSITGIEVVPN